LVTMAMAAILNFFNPQKLTHTTGWCIAILRFFFTIILPHIFVCLISRRCLDQTLWNLTRISYAMATFNNISVILWWSVLLVEVTAVPVENPTTISLRPRPWRPLLHKLIFFKYKKHTKKSFVTTV
jgi:hypothetical protein